MRIQTIQKGRIESFYQKRIWSCGFWLWARKIGNKWVKVEAIDVNSDLMNNYRNQDW